METRDPVQPEAQRARLRLFDTHVHLNLDAYDGDRDETIERARAAGVELMINVGFDRATSRGSIELAERYASIYATVGVHPHGAASLDDELMGELRRMAVHPRVVAIGETGLDYYRDLSPREEQRGAFRAQIRLAKEVGLPLIIHNRDALEDVLAIVDEERAGEVGGVMHCFPGDADYAAEVVARGFHVGVGGPVTYSSKGRLAGVARSVPRGRLLIETDAPWLTPEPERARMREQKVRLRNEPAYVALVAEAVARLRGVDVSDLARATFGNAVRLFGIPDLPEPSIAYEMWGNLYLNITNRCTNECRFCVRYQSDVLWGYNLRLDREPTVEEIVGAIGDPTRFREVVFCGYGEPTIRLDVLKAVAARVREAGGRVRLDTNGQGNLIWNRNVAPELASVLDSVSVSLNAQDAETYARVCRPRFGEVAFGHVVAFIKECKKAGLEVTASVVDVPEVDLEAVGALARDLGVPLKVRGRGEPRRSEGG